MALLEFIRNLFYRDKGTRFFFGRSDTNEIVNQHTSLQSSAFSACVDILASDIGSLPFVSYKKNISGRDRAADHSLYPILHDSVNEYMTSQNWREVLVYDTLLTGNHCSFIDWQGGQVASLYPIPPDKITPYKDNQGRLLYEVTGYTTPLTPDQIFHVPGLAWDGIRGKSIIENHANTIGVSLAVDRHASRFFGSGCQMSGIIEMPGKMDTEAFKETIRGFNETYCGADNSHKVAGLMGGAKFTTLQVTNEQSQFLETRKYSAIDICRLPGLRIPPHMIGALERSTWANIESQGIDYTRYTLRRWITKIENEVNRKLWREDEKGTYYAELLVDAIQRGDQTTRYNNYQTGIQNGFITPKMVAEWENWNSDNMSDVPLSPLNMQPAPAVGPAVGPAPAVEQQSTITNSLTKEQRREKFRVLIEDAARRCITKETKALQRLAKKHLPDVALWENSVAEFIEGHTDCVRNSFRPICLTYNKNKADSILHKIVEHFKNTSLDALCGKQTLEEINIVLESWNTRHINIGEQWAGGYFG